MATSGVSPGPWTWEYSLDPHDTSCGEILDADGEAVCDFGHDVQYYPIAGHAPNEADLAVILKAFLIPLIQQAAYDEGLTPHQRWQVICQLLEGCP